MSQRRQKACKIPGRLLPACNKTLPVPLTTSVTDPKRDKYLVQLIANWCLINEEIASEVQDIVTG